MAITIVVHTATRIVLMAGADITAATINAGKAGWCQDYVSIDTDVLGWGHGLLSTASISIYEGVTLPAGFLPYCWTYSALGAWSQINNAAVTAAVAYKLLGNSRVVAIPTDLRLSPVSYTYNSGTSARVDLIATWVSSQSISPITYELRYRVLNGEWFETVFVGYDTTYSIQALDANTYEVGVRGRNESNFVSEWLTGAVSVPIPDSFVPNVTGFLVTAQQDGTRLLSWGLDTVPPDLAGYRIKFRRASGAAWSNMADLHSGLLTASPYETNQLSAGDYTFAIVAVDIFGNESLSPLYIQTTLPDQRLANVWAYSNGFSDGWSGVKTGCYITREGILEATDSATWADLNSWATWEQWNNNPAASFTYETPVIDALMSIAYTPQVWAYGVGVMTYQMATSADNTTWSAWGELAKSDARYIKFKITVASAGSIACLTELTTCLVVKPLTEEINDLATATLTGLYRYGPGDIRLPMVNTYSIAKQISVTLQNTGPGWSWELVDKDLITGPRIKIYNASGTLADATIDAYIKGL